MNDALTWFRRELKIIGTDAGANLRVVRDRGRLGVDLWVVERELPPSIHEASLEYLRSCGHDRFVDQILTDECGTEVGRRRMDLAPEWAVAHICSDKDFDRDDPRAYREPNAADLMSIRRWLFEFKDPAEQLRVFHEEHKAAEDAKKRDAMLATVKDIKSSHVLRDLTFKDAPKKVLAGTEIQTEPAKFNIVTVP